MNERSYENLEGVHPKLIKILENASKKCEFTVTEGVRSAERQAYLYAQGRTNNGRIVTNIDGFTKRSNHQTKQDGYGYAVDIYAEPIDVNDTIRIADVAKIIKNEAKKLNLVVEWGGDWNMRDYPHFELKGTYKQQ